MDEPILPPGHSGYERLELDLPGIGSGGSISVVMPCAYGMAHIDIGGFAVLSMVMQCVICAQPCWVSPRAIGVALKRVCWDCIDEQVPGFAARKLAERRG